MKDRITAGNALFVLLSFEGPDSYSLAGGLGVRVSHLSHSLAESGFPVHLLFVGDPKLKGEEVRGRLVLHRWCTWISAYYPEGVYQGENDKLNDFTQSAPQYVVEQIVKPAVAQGKVVVILAEEWQTAETMCRISEMLWRNGLRDRAILFWNANNTYGFERINWAALGSSATITTVSRYMKQIMKGMGLDAQVIPNGIPKTLLDKVDVAESEKLRERLNTRLVLSKVARWDPDKRWDMAMEATARLKARGLRTTLLARGGIEPYGGEVLHNARSLGLTVEDVEGPVSTLDDYYTAIQQHNNADVLNLKFYCPQDFLRIVYHASDAVLANSGHEPFGLVGLEAMAAGGIAFTGGTGEDYAIPSYNSILLETADPDEIASSVAYLDEYPSEKASIRMAARETARWFTWDSIIKILVRKLECQGRNQGLLAQTSRRTEKGPKKSMTPVGTNAPQQDVALAL